MAKKTAAPDVIDLDTIPLVDDPANRQFVLTIGDKRARMEYDRSSDRIFLTHLVVPPALEGHGVAAALTEKVFTWIEEHKMKMVPYCPYVKVHLRSHPAWQRLLVKGLHI